jgi:hypothetical protein
MASNAAKQLRAIAERWPGDPLRPNIQLKTFTSSLADHPKLTENAVRNMENLQNNVLKKKVRVRL